MISAISFIKDGKVKPIVVLNDERITKIDEMKDVPTTVEKGVNVTIGSWRGFAVKKDTPEEVRQYLVDKMKAVYETEEYKQFAEQNLADLVEGYQDPEQFRKEWQDQYEIFDKISTQIGLK